MLSARYLQRSAHDACLSTISCGMSRCTTPKPVVEASTAVTSGETEVRKLHLTKNNVLRAHLSSRSTDGQRRLRAVKPFCTKW